MYIIIIDLSSTPETMIDAIRHTAKEMTSKVIASISIVGTALLILLKPGVSTANEGVKNEIAQVLKQFPVKEVQIKTVEEDNSQTYILDQGQDIIGDSDAFQFALNNVDRYYPDMKEHLATMLTSFRDDEQRDTTLALLNAMIADISDPAQKTGAVIYALEMSVCNSSMFIKEYDSKIHDNTFTYIEGFDKGYKARFKRYYARLAAETERLKKELTLSKNKLNESTDKLNESTDKLNESTDKLNESTNKLNESKANLQKVLNELNALMSKFTPRDVKTNASIKNLVIETERFYKEGRYEIPSGVQALFDAAKQ